MRADQLGVQDRVIFLGHRKDIREILAVQRCLAQLDREARSLRAGDRGIPRFGHPVVAYDHGGAAEQLEIMLPSGRVPVGDLERATQTVADFLRTPNHRDRAPLHPGPDATVHLGGVRGASFSDVRKGTPGITLT